LRSFAEVSVDETEDQLAFQDVSERAKEAAPSAHRALLLPSRPLPSRMTRGAPLTWGWSIFYRTTHTRQLSLSNAGLLSRPDTSREGMNDYAVRLKGSRVVFNIKGNDYRLITVVQYANGVLLIRFLGSHEEYDKVDAETV
jgi:mRNA-degrading endonuclease HigB of HigAB toxin-antitoxin module